MIKSCYEFLEFSSKQEDEEIEDLTEDQITEQTLEKAFLEIQIEFLVFFLDFLLFSKKVDQMPPDLI